MWWCVVLIHAVEYVGTLIATACRDCTVSEEAANMKAESKQPQTVITLDPTPYEKHLEYWMVSCELLNRLVDVIAYSNQLLGAKKQADRNRSPSADLIAPHVQALWVMCSMALATIANVNKYLKAIADSKVLFAVRSLVCSTEGLMVCVSSVNLLIGCVLFVSFIATSPGQVRSDCFAVFD